MAQDTGQSSESDAMGLEVPHAAYPGNLERMRRAPFPDTRGGARRISSGIRGLVSAGLRWIMPPDRLEGGRRWSGSRGGVQQSQSPRSSHTTLGRTARHEWHQTMAD